MADPRTCSKCGAEFPPGGLSGVCPRCLLELARARPEEGSLPVVLTAGDAAPPPPEPAAIQPHFPQLEIEALVGQGGMGVVYRARHRGLDRAVALKLLPAAAGRDPSFVERFQREARALASLSHPNIVGVHDFGRAGEHFYLVMEFVDGVDLRRMIRAGEVTPAQALSIVGQICEALQYAHGEAVVHRDIKPENVLVDRRGRVKITDFGLARLLGRDEGRSRLTGDRQVMGTPHYMAPEQVDRPREVDHRADIFSLGVVFYELLTGELPMGRFDPPSHRSGVDARLDEVVLKSLEREPARRYQQASEVKTDVDHIAAEPAGAPVPAAAAAGTGAPERRRSMAPWILLGCLGLAGAGMFFCVFASLFRFGGVEYPAEPVPDAPPASAPVDATPPLHTGACAAIESAGKQDRVALRSRLLRELVQGRRLGEHEQLHFADAVLGDADLAGAAAWSLLQDLIAHQDLGEDARQYVASRLTELPGEAARLALLNQLFPGSAPPAAPSDPAAIHALIDSALASPVPEQRARTLADVARDWRLGPFEQIRLVQAAYDGAGSSDDAGAVLVAPVSYTHLTLPTIYSV